ncbi:MAG: thioredoxin-dependent thiol peroxidase [Thermoflexibacter sp.]|jgi:peroxiredoxin Q/BCP|nr:thioredoxin-dependent thiol peroxidase [Thermoflexibacter sp.]
MTILKIGDKAPDFEGIDQDGNSIKLSDFKNKKVILYFYPRDLTEVCTEQACNLRDNYEDLKKKGYEVIGISSDDEKTHRKFIAKYQLPFRLIADTDNKIHFLYDTWKEKKMFGKPYMGTIRTTFIIDEKGIITNIITKVKAKEHAKQIIS